MKYFKNRRLNTALTQIQQADDAELTQIINAVIRRYGIQYPDQEAMFLTLPKNDPEERRNTLNSIFDLLKNNGQI